MMTNDDELARMRKAFAASAGAPEPEACPPPDHIWQAVHGELPPDGMRRVVEHVAVCSACAEDWRIAMAFEEEARTAAPAHTVAPLRTAVARYRPWLAAAAAVFVLTVVGIEMRQPQGPGPEPIFRSGETQTVKPLLPKGAALPRERFVLRWEPVPGAETYSLVVTSADADMRVLADLQGLKSTEYQVPESDLAGIPSGTDIHWKVTPVFLDGGTLQAPTFTNRIQ